MILPIILPWSPLNTCVCVNDSTRIIPLINDSDIDLYIEPISIETPVADDLMLVDYIADDTKNLPTNKTSHLLLEEDI